MKYQKRLLLFVIMVLATGMSCTIGTPDDPEPFTAVFSPSGSGWDSYSVADPFVYYDSSSAEYIMYYAGCDSGMNYEIGYATSSDGISWIRPDLGSGDNIVIHKGGLGTWNESGVISPMVIKENSTTYHMWFTGYDSGNTKQIGYASSKNGTEWTVNPSPILSASGIGGRFDEKHVCDPSVFYDSGTFSMWYTGIDIDGYFSIGYDESTTPDSFSNPTDNLTNMEPYPDSYLSTGVRAGDVLYDSSEALYKMWPTASNPIYSVAYAQSDTIDSGWNLHAEPVLINHATGFDAYQVGLCSVIEDPDSSGYVMWYSGWSSSGISIGMAESDNGLYWTKYR